MLQKIHCCLYSEFFFPAQQFTFFFILSCMQNFHLFMYKSQYLFLHSWIQNFYLLKSCHLLLEHCYKAPVWFSWKTTVPNLSCPATWLSLNEHFLTKKPACNAWATLNQYFYSMNSSPMSRVVKTGKNSG